MGALAAAGLILVCLAVWSAYLIGKNRQHDRADTLERSQMASNLVGSPPRTPSRPESATRPLRDGRGKESTAQPKSQPGYIGNRETLVYHLPTCRFVLSMAERNSTPLAAQQAKKEGYRPCDKCRPDDPDSNKARIAKEK